jgi:hypothetical protein
MQAPLPDQVAVPIGEVKKPTNQHSRAPFDQPRADRLTRSKWIYRAAQDAMILGDEEEAARLWALWYALLELR